MATIEQLEQLMKDHIASASNIGDKIEKHLDKLEEEIQKVIICQNSNSSKIDNLTLELNKVTDKLRVGDDRLRKLEDEMLRLDSVLGFVKWILGFITAGGLTTIVGLILTIKK